MNRDKHKEQHSTTEHEETETLNTHRHRGQLDRVETLGQRETAETHRG